MEPINEDLSIAFVRSHQITAWLEKLETIREGLGLQCARVVNRSFDTISIDLIAREGMFSFQ